MSDAGAGSPTDLFEESLVATVSRVVYEHPDSNWAVVRLESEEGDEITAVGNLAPVFEGEVLELEGAWADDPRFGRQFRVSRATAARPTSPEAIERYLGSGLIPGLGPELASRLVAAFGERTLDVIGKEPERLLEVDGIGEVRLARIREAWEEQAAERSSRIFLQGLGIGPAIADRILAAWGTEAESMIRGDPYLLSASDEIQGMGFRRADAVARQLPGWERGGRERARAGLRHVLDRQAANGHCFVPDGVLVRSAAELLEIDDEAVVRRALEEMVESRELVAEPLDDEAARSLGLEATVEEGSVRAIYRSAFRAAERRVAERLAAIHATGAGDGLPGALHGSRLERACDWVGTEIGIDLGGDQERALRQTLASKLLLVTGGPGTGKTTLIDAVVRCARALKARVALAAPTGRAAKRLSEATGHDARTLHRLLEYRPPAGFLRGPGRPLEVDLLVVDEASMVDLFLMDALLAAVPPEASLLLVGDADQLPPVGPGAVLKDLLDSGALPTVRLTEIYRQARRSLIVRNAHRINAGSLPEGMRRAPDDRIGAARDFYFIEEEAPDRARELVVELAARRIPERFGVEARRDIQVVAPMHRGKAGVSRLNEALQGEVVPTAPGSLRAGEISFRPGDRIIQHRNDYDREVFNGDVGFVLEVRGEGNDVGLSAEFDGRRVEFDRDALRELGLAYAISIHKSQGSEYPVVITVLLPEHWVMLQRNLLYTALTRAKKLAVLVGSRRAVGRAVRNDAPMQRCTRLAQRLRAAMAS